MAWLNGKKTFIVAIAAIIYAVVRLWTGELGVDEAIIVILGALGFGALRSGLKK